MHHSTPALAQPRQVFAIVSVGVILTNLDLFSINVALPRIAADFAGSTLDELTWVLNGYAIAFASLLVFAGRMAEGFRRDRSFMLGVAIFTLASAACATASGVWSLVAWRVLAATGAALMTPTSLGLLLSAFPPDQRAQTVRNWAGVGGFAAALGPLVGGVLVTFSWRWIFIFNAFVGMAALAVAWRQLPAVPGHAVARPSPIASMMVTAGIAALVFGITKGHAWGRSSPAVLASLTGAVLLLGAFVAHCQGADHPLVDPALFRIRPFSTSAWVLVPYSMVFGALLFSISIWCQTSWGWSALRTGLSMCVGPLLVPVTSMLFGTKLIARFGGKSVIAAGLCFFAAAFAVWAGFIGQTPQTSVVVIGMAFSGIGVGLAFPTLMGMGTQALPASAFATGAGVINMLRQAAMAIGVAMFVALVGAPTNGHDKLESFHTSWWAMSILTVLAAAPLLRLRVAIASTTGNTNKSPP